MGRVRAPREAFHRLGLIRLAFRLIWVSTRWLMVWWLAVTVVKGAIPGGIVYTTKWVVDAVTGAFGQAAADPAQAVAAVLLPVLLMGALLIGQRIVEGLSEWVNAAQSDLVLDHVKGLIHEKAARVDYGFFYSSTYYDQLEQANSQAGARAISILNNLGGILQSGVTLASIAGIIAGYAWWLPVVLVSSTIPAFLVVLHLNQKQHRWWTKTTADRRRVQYYDIMLTQQQAAAEVRILGLSGYFTSGYKKLRAKLRQESLGIIKYQTIAKTVAAAGALLVTGAVMGWIILRAWRGNATIGDLALFYQAFTQGQGLMSTLLNNMGQIYANTLFLDHLRALLNQPDHVRDPDAPRPFPARLQEGIRFEGVTFTYPGSERPAIKDFDLDIQAGKITAIVGENGAGKSTLTKLLCRFYDPEQGKVSVDGTDLRMLKQDELRRQIAIMFQFPMKYQFTASDNIRLGDLAGHHTLADIERAAKGAGADDLVQKLPQGYDTQLGYWFEGGVELSGGEWQRLALARAFLRDAQILVLDEPTSFMDSWAEQGWLERFRKLVVGRTTLIITHRFTTAMLADTIHVMDGGQVVESGTHDELLRLGGRYASSWFAQMNGHDTDAPKEDVTSWAAGA